MKHECYKCKNTTDNFYKSSLIKKDYICKPCSVIRNSVDRSKRTARNDLNARFSYAKASAKSSGKNWSLTKEEYCEIVSKNCHYCDKPSEGLGVGLDRINNDKTIGYTISNVLPCCKDCNRIRSNLLTVEETKVAIQAIIRFRTYGRIY